LKVFDELSYAKKLLEFGFTKKYITIGELIILAKYFRYLGKDDQDILEELENFCKKYFPGYIDVLHYEKIEMALGSLKSVLRIPIDISITTRELNSIRSLKNYRYEKVLFVMLALGKYYKLTNTGKSSKTKEYYINCKNSTIFRLAHVSEKKNENIMHILYKNGFINNNVRTNSYYLTFTTMDDMSESAVNISDINNITHYYPLFCEDCGKLLATKSKMHCKCSDCYNKYRKLSVKNNAKRQYSTNSIRVSN